MRRNRSKIRKERVIMLASSVFVLTALTMTGFYVKEKNEEEKDGYVVDMSTLEKKTEDKTKEIARSLEEQEELKDSVKGNDLDYDPNFQEVASADVTNSWESVANKDIAQEEIADEGIMPESVPEETVAEARVQVQSEEAKVQAQPEEAAAEAKVQVQSEEVVAEALSFQEKDQLAWPVAGNVLINYSMDKTVYFPTLQQYKYNPAIIIGASEGENITAAADGKVLSVFEDAKIGQAVTVDIGNGYELTYGQLKDIMVLQGDVISSGDVIGRVAAPTKYYSVEGPNVYFKLSKDGLPINPLSWLE